MDRFKIALIDSGFLLRSAQVCKKFTLLGNLRTITKERKKKLGKWFFSSTFWGVTVCDIHFCIWKLSKFIFMGSSLSPFWSAKYLNFGSVSSETRILSRSVQETYTLRKVKNQVLLFYRVENQICLISWSTFGCSRMLYCIGLKAYRQISKKLVIKHAKFQFLKVHPDGVI